MSAVQAHKLFQNKGINRKKILGDSSEKYLS